MILKFLVMGEKGGKRGKKERKKKKNTNRKKKLKLKRTERRKTGEKMRKRSRGCLPHGVFSASANFFRVDFCAR